jgi:hypothetical protein
MAAVFSVLPVSGLYNEENAEEGEHQPLEATTKQRLRRYRKCHVCCSTGIYRVCRFVKLLYLLVVTSVQLTELSIQTPCLVTKYVRVCA